MDEQIIKFLNKTFILVAILVAGILIFLFAVIGYQQKSLDQQNTNQITVSGEGKVYAKPDVAIISLGVTTTGATVADVTKSNTDKMNAVIDAVKKLGVADKDIQTTNYNLSPVYNNNVILPTPVVAPGVAYNTPYISATTGTILKGYTLEQDVQVKIRDFTKIGDILAKSLKEQVWDASRRMKPEGKAKPEVSQTETMVEKEPKSQSGQRKLIDF